MKIILDNYTLYMFDNCCKLVSPSETYYGKWNGHNGYKLHNKGYGGEIILVLDEDRYTIKWFGSGIPVIAEEHGSILEYIDEELQFSLDNECNCSSCTIRRDPNYVVLLDGSICRRDFLQTAEELNLQRTRRVLDSLFRL